MLRTATLAIVALTLPACGQRAELPTSGPSPIYSNSEEDSPKATGYRTETVIEGLGRPWSVTWLPDGGVLITERGGRVVLAEPDGDGGFEAPVPLGGAPESSRLGQGGMMDVSLHPAFDDNALVYFTHATGDGRANRTVLSRARLVRGEAVVRFEDTEELFRVTPDKPGGQHFGSRLVWLPDGTLLMSVGDGGNPPTRVGGRLARDNPQFLDNAWGKVLRLNDDGTAPDDNPFSDREDVGRFVYSYGHRNIQGMDIDPATGNVWATEHGALGGDELNLIEPGKNYGWPKATYSIHYNGDEISDEVSLEGMVDPACVWTPVLAACGLAFYTGDRFPQWQGDLFAGGLVSRQVRRVMLDGEGDGTTVEANETLPFGARIRDVRQGPDGSLYVLTDERNGKLIRIVPE